MRLTNFYQLGRTGDGPQHRVWFFAESNCDELTDDDLKDYQTKLGYPPEGYDFIKANYCPFPVPVTEYDYRIWCCSASCE